MTEQKSRRGFAGMSAEKRRRIAQRGGQAAQKKGAHRWTPEEARARASAGGKARHLKAVARPAEVPLTAEVGSSPLPALSPASTPLGVPIMRQLATALRQVQVLGSDDAAAGLAELQRASEDWAIFSLRTFRGDDLTCALAISTAISAFLELWDDRVDEARGEGGSGAPPGSPPTS